MSYLRPPSPYETAPAKRPAEPAPAEASPTLSIRVVLARSLDAVRRHWPVLGLLTYGLGFLPLLALSLGIHLSYRHGHDDPAALAISLARTLAVAFCMHFARATVTSVVVKPGGGAARALASTIAALPALVPLWLASEYDTFWSYWVAWSWSGDLHGASTAIITRLEMQSLATLLVTLVIALGSAAALGVLSAVVIAERLTLPSAVIRCWGLMRGNRWRVVALYVLVAAVLILLTFPRARGCDSLFGRAIPITSSPRSSGFRAGFPRP